MRREPVSCFIEMTGGRNHIGKVLWAWPRGGRSLTYANEVLSTLRPGDVVLHYYRSHLEEMKSRQGKYIGVSKVSKPCIDQNKIKELDELYELLKSFDIVVNKEYKEFIKKLFERSRQKFPLNICIVKITDYIEFDRPIDRDVLREALRYYEKKLASLHWLLHYNVSSYLVPIPCHAVEDLLRYLGKENLVDKLFKEPVQTTVSREFESSCKKLKKILGDKLEDAKRLLKSQGSILLYGPPGTGKTSLARCLSLELNAKLYEFTVHGWTSRAHVIGGYVLKGGSIEWEDGIVVKAARSSKPSIILFDEINRGEPERFISELFTALADPARKLVIPETGEELSLKDIYVVATANSADIVALARMGFALLRRFPTLMVGADEVFDKGFVSKLANFMEENNITERSIDIAIKVWIKIIDTIKSIRERQKDWNLIAPGWGFAIQYAKLLDGGLDCVEAGEAVYFSYVHHGIVSSDKIREVLKDACRQF